MKVSQFKQIATQIIKESINDRITNIDKAGNIAKVRAQLDQINKDIEQANTIKTSFASIENLDSFIDPKVTKQVTSALDKSIKQLDVAKSKTEKELDVIENGKVKKTAHKDVEKMNDEDSVDLGDSGEEEVKQAA